MPMVTLLLPEGHDMEAESTVSFAVAPVVGESVLLNVNGERWFYLVDEVFHGMTSEGDEILYFARLSRAPDAAPVDLRTGARH